MNNNSSRYGKFLMLQFGASGRLVGARVNTYLLEKTRVVAPGLARALTLTLAVTLTQP